ncbi:GntR family transcriptional regulator [Nonomuraea angiospora]|uniref:GntR family transcriptional regulator n=1 Tax=Nonomuraea angiospora TaxID=46172 RepID=UPI0029A56E91|nr:GntR family transcriptional regulator [Nonomuraea angiospora]MDX3105338.1 GntR family transcriptional regulator [Nonomuraea angiospora]
MTVPPEFALGPASITDALYESVRRRIINEELGPGEKVTEARLSTEYGVARPTAKACVERLVVVGLLQRSTHKSAVVPTLGTSDIEDLFTSRIAIESASVQILAAGGKVPAEAEQAQGDIELATERGSYEHIVAADIAYHRSLVAGTGSRRLVRMYELIVGEIELTMGRYSAHKATSRASIPEEHAAILEAIRSGDPDAAVERSRAHLVAARQRLLAHVSND